MVAHSCRPWASESFPVDAWQFPSKLWRFPRIRLIYQIWLDIGLINGKHVAMSRAYFVLKLCVPWLRFSTTRIYIFTTKRHLTFSGPKIKGLSMSLVADFGNDDYSLAVRMEGKLVQKYHTRIYKQIPCKKEKNTRFFSKIY